MRVMQIPRFPRKVEILNLEHFLRARLSQTVVMWPDQAIPLAGYMAWPNDTPARDSAVEILQRGHKPRCKEAACCPVGSKGHQFMSGGPSGPTRSVATTRTERRSRSRGRKTGVVS